MFLLPDLLLQGDGAGGLVAGLGVLLVVFGILALAIVILSVVVVVQAHKAGREGWWVYLLAVFLSPLNLVAIIGWFAHWKDHPLMVHGKPFL